MPRVYDKEGNELTVGARVEAIGDVKGTFAGTKVEPFGFVALVDFSDSVRGVPFYLSPRTNRAIDLLLIDSPTSTDQANREEAASAAPKGVR